MRSRICSLFLGISLLLTASVLHAEDKNSLKTGTKEGDSKPEAPLFGGVYLSTDVFGYIFPIFMSDTYHSAEVSASVDLKHRFYPTAEVGYGYCNTVGELYGIRYATAAPYLRIGMDYNLQYEKGAPNYILAGFRLGGTRAPYEVEAASLIDPVYGTEVPFHLTDMPCTSLWAEALVGVRAQIASGFYMGWTLRYKRMLHTSNRSENGSPWYVPGYGVYGKDLVGATYNLTWYFSVKGKNPAKK